MGGYTVIYGEIALNLNTIVPYCLLHIENSKSKQSFVFLVVSLILKVFFHRLLLFFGRATA